MRIPIACVAVMSFVCSTATVSAQSRASCDRTCLTGLLDRYVDALVARDPSRLPVAPTVKFTENGQRLELGDGLWHTVTAKGRYRLDMADVDAGQAVLMGTIREADTPTILVLRLGVVQQKIAEVETLVIRNKDAAESLDTIAAPRRAWYTAVPESERHSRDELARIANMYFSGIELQRFGRCAQWNAQGRPPGLVGAQHSVDLADCRVLQDRKGADRPGRVRAASGPVRDGLRLDIASSPAALVENRHDGALVVARG